MKWRVGLGDQLYLGLQLIRGHINKEVLCSEEIICLV